jgi:two-component system, cell cycle sensor histidine kinase and response regulator CckA
MTDLASVRVLIVDDNRAEFVLARELLAEVSAPGYTVDWASTATEGLKRLSTGGVDVALVDYCLPDATGIDVIRQAVAAGCRVPLILFTGRGDQSVDVEAMEVGAADYLNKSEATPSTLDRAIRYAIRQQRTIELVRHSEERFRALIENSADGMLLTDANATILFASESMEAISGFAPAAAIGHSAFQAVHPDDVKPLRDLLRTVLENPGVPIRTTYRALHSTGAWRHREAIVTNRLDVPAVRAIVVNYQDITDRILAEAQQAHLAAIVASADDAIIGATLDGTIVSWNAAAERLYGYPSREMIGQPISLLIQSDRTDAGSMLESLRRGERIPHFEARRPRKDGSPIHVSMGIAPILDAAGRPTGMAAVARDVTERLRAEEAARAAEERMRFTLETAHVVLYDANLVTREMLWSDTMAAVTGIPAEKFPRSYDEFVALVYGDDRGQLVDAIERATPQAGVFSVEYRLPAADGEYRWHECRGRVLFGAAGTPVRLLGVAMDVTDRKRLEQQFRQAQKMEAVGHLAGGIAHDFNNMLTAILGYCELALEANDDLDQAADLEEIRKAADRAARLTRQLLAFSRKQFMVPRVIRLNEVVGDLKGMLDRLVGEHIDFELVQDAALGWIKADPSQIEQVLMNLVVNARDAMPTGGRLTISTADVTLDAEFVRGHPGATAGRYAALSVHDTGCGMTPDVLSHVFEPFFTTKEPGKGTGLGLSTVYGIVKQNGGYIDVRSTPNRGTSFTACFPVVEGEALPTPQPAMRPRAVKPTETILLVEDEPRVRAVIEKTLRHAGYMVLVANDVEDAIAIERSHPSPIHLLLTDVVMPRMSGPDLAEYLIGRRPEIGILYVSGFADHLTRDPRIISERAAFLHKPFTPAVLTRKVRERLDSPLVK